MPRGLSLNMEVFTICIYTTTNLRSQTVHSVYYLSNVTPFPTSTNGSLPDSPPLYLISRNTGSWSDPLETLKKASILLLSAHCFVLKRKQEERS